MSKDTIYRQGAIDALGNEPELWEDPYSLSEDYSKGQREQWNNDREVLLNLPSAQLEIKQAAKLLSDFIESCPGGDSYLITPDGEELRTDWGYATEGIQLINDWAERSGQ